MTTEAVLDPQSNQKPKNRLADSLHPTAFFLFLEFEQQLLQSVERLVRVGADRLEDNARAAIEIGAEHLEDAVGGKALLALSNRDLGVELMYATHKLRCRTRVQAKLIQDFDFSPHDAGTINDPTPAASDSRRPQEISTQILLLHD